MTHKPKYCLFYDNHTMGACSDVGANFDVEMFTDRIKDCGVDYLTFHARCNQGFTYYDTKIGIRHPSLEYDLFGRLAEACERKEIMLTAYLNGGLSSEEGRLHRNWTKIDPDGRTYQNPPLTAYVRKMCCNTPYRDHLIAMVREIAENYPVSGFFIDCLQSHPCVCPVCVQEMKKLGIDWRDEKQVVKFAESSCLRISEDIAKAAREINPDFMLYFNNPSFEDLKDFSSHFECECLPTAGWGYDTLPTMAHYMRTIGKEYPILNMTGRFNNWGDFGGLRTEAGLEYDLLYGLANCMRPNVGGHFHPRGDTIHPVFDRIEKIYKKLQLREPWYDGAENLTDIAVVFPKDIVAIRSDNSLVGAVRILSELKCQFDIVTECSNWEKYSLLVIPDNVTFNDEVAERVKAHISKGGAVIASGESGLNKEESAFALENEWGVKHIGKSDLNPAYFELPKSLSHGLPDMPLSVYAGGEEVEPLPDTVVESKLIKPYYNTHWDGVDAFVYNPPEKTVKAPFLTTKGKVAYFSFRIFEGYFNQAPFHLREMFGNVLNHLLPHPILKTEGLPSFARVFVTKQPDRTMVHLLAYVPEKRGKTQAVDEPITVLDSKISLKCGDTAPQKAYLAPDMNNELPIEQCDGYAAVLLPRFTGYAILVLE